MKLLAAAILVGLTPSLADAANVRFTYSGSDPDDGYVTSAGVGFFSSAKDGALTLADLTGFAFDFTVTSSDPSLAYSDTFHYSLSDLTSFSANATGTGLSSLALRTGYASPPDNFLAPEYIRVTSLATGGLISYFGPGDDAQHGTIRVAAAVPEPATWAMLILGMGAVGYALRRRQRVTMQVSYAA